MVRLAAPAQRIVSLLPSHTETVLALGIADRLVACDDYSALPAELASLPRVGGLEPSVEALLMLEPDLVLAGEYGTQAAVVEQAGLTVYAGSAQTYEDVFRKIAAIGRLTGREEQARAHVTGLRARIEAIEARLRDRDRPRVYFEIDATPYTVGPRSFIGTLLEKAGGQNIVTERAGEFPVIAPEEIIASDPEVMIGLSLEDARARPGWDRITAVRTGRVRALTRAEREQVSHPGPRLDQGLLTLARIIHPETGAPP